MIAIACEIGHHYNRGAMKRLVLILVLLAFSAQAPWAAAAAYCMHEQDLVDVHFGHHDHKHRPASTQAGGAQSGWDGDSDCGICHLTGCKSSQSCVWLPRFEGVPGVAPAASPSYSSFIPDGPERPSWIALA